MHGIHANAFRFIWNVCIHWYEILCQRLCICRCAFANCHCICDWCFACEFRIGHFMLCDTISFICMRSFSMCVMNNVAHESTRSLYKLIHTPMCANPEWTVSSTEIVFLAYIPRALYCKCGAFKSRKSFWICDKQNASLSLSPIMFCSKASRSGFWKSKSTFLQKLTERKTSDQRWRYNTSPEWKWNIFQFLEKFAAAISNGIDWKLMALPILKNECVTIELFHMERTKVRDPLNLVILMILNCLSTIIW